MRVGQLGVGGVAQEQHPAAGDDGRVGLGQAERLEQGVHLGVGLEVDPGEQHAVPRQEVADAEGVLRVARADHPQPREVRRRPQQLPPGDERLEDDVAERRALVDDPPQVVRGDLVGLAVAARHGADDRRRPGQVRDVPGELARPGPWTANVRGSSPLRSTISIRAGLDDEELEVAVAGLNQFLPVLVPLRCGQGAAGQASHLLLVQPGKRARGQVVFGHVILAVHRSGCLSSMRS